MAEEPFRPDPAAQAEALRRMGARIAARRKALGLTQKQLAARLLVSDKTVSKWELGGSCPDPALLVPLARTLGLTVDELLTGKAPPAPQNAPPAGESPAAGKTPAPAPDGWLRWRLDQKAAGISLLGLLLGGAGYSLFLPMQSLLGGQVGWVPAGLVVVAAVYLSFFLNPNTIGGAAFLWLALGFALVTYCNAFLVLRAFRDLPELAEEETT